MPVQAVFVSSKGNFTVELVGNDFKSITEMTNDCGY